MDDTTNHDSYDNVASAPIVPDLPRELVNKWEILRRPAKPVSSLREGLEIGRKLVGILERHNAHAKRTNRKDVVQKGVMLATDAGIGLAATQIGIAKQVCVFKNGNFYQTLVNPRIVSWSDGSDFLHVEGCLSLPGLQVEVWRYSSVTVEDWKSGVVTYGLDVSLRTACVQHECQHLAGICVDFIAGKGIVPPNQWESLALSQDLL